MKTPTIKPHAETAVSWDTILRLIELIEGPESRRVCAEIGMIDRCCRSLAAPVPGTTVATSQKTICGVTFEYGVSIAFAGTDPVTISLAVDAGSR